MTHPQMRTLRLTKRCQPLLVLLACLEMSCGTDESPPSRANNTDTKDPVKEPDSGADVIAPAKCDIPTFEDDAEPVPFESVSATIVDENGDPIPDLLAQACGTNVCLNAKTGSNGVATINQATDIAKLAFKYGDGVRYAHVAVLLPEGEATYELGTLPTLRLPDGDPANRFELGASLSSSGTRLLLGDNTVVTLDLLSYPDAEDHVFVARQFEDAMQPLSIAAEAFDAVWAFGPQKTKFCPPAQLTLPNTSGLPVGSEVDLYLLVTSVDGQFARYAEWGNVATATVVADGTQIQTNEDAGLPELGIIGLRGSN